MFKIPYMHKNVIIFFFQFLFTNWGPYHLHYQWARLLSLWEEGLGFLYFYKYSVCFVSGVPYLLGADLYCAPFPPLQLSANWKTEGFYYKFTRTLNKNEDFLYICDKIFFFPCLLVCSDINYSYIICCCISSNDTWALDHGGKVQGAI